MDSVSAEEPHSTNDTLKTEEGLDINSNISGLGKRRDLHDATQEQDGSSRKDCDSADDDLQRSRKRPKHSDEVAAVSTANETTASLPTATSLECTVASSIIPHSNVQSEATQAFDTAVVIGGALIHDPPLTGPQADEVLHALPASLDETPKAMEQASPVLPIAESQGPEAHKSAEDTASGANAFGTYDLTAEMETRSLASPPSLTAPSTSQVDVKSTGWNKGVQTGLRLSFSGAQIPSNSPKAAIKRETELHSNVLPQVSLGMVNSDDENDSDPSDNDRFKKLTPQQKKELSPAARRDYSVAYAAHKRKRNSQAMIKNTEKADKLLAREKRWPVSQIDVVRSIREGRTFYPRDCTPLKYTNTTGSFDLLPVWDSEGIPIKAQNFSFNEFAPAFLRQNKHKAIGLTSGDLRGAFHMYCRGFYKQLKAKQKPLLETVNAHNALTLEEALKLANLSDGPLMRAASVQHGKRPSDIRRSAEGWSEHEDAYASTRLSNPIPFKALPEQTSKRAIVEIATEEAERIIKLVGWWPLPPEYSSVSHSIATGKTFYPQSPSKKQVWSKGGESWDMSEIFDEHGWPIKVQDFSFNTFSIEFSRLNTAKNWHCLRKASALSGAFNFYCSMFYSHVLSFSSSTLRTADAPDALTTEEARALAKRKPKSSMTQKTQTPVPANNTPEQVPSDVRKHVGANVVTGDNCSLDEQAGQDSTVSVDNGQIKRLVTLKQLSKEAGTEQKQALSVDFPRSIKVGNASTISTTPTLQSQEPAVSIGSSANSQARDQMSTTPVAQSNDIIMSDISSSSKEIKNKGKSAVRDSAPVHDPLLQRRYFPSVDTFSARCLACAGVGHTPYNCPALQCTVCSTHGDHSNITCPQNARCRRCFQRGHATDSCSERLMASRSESESVPCNTCGLAGHLEASCHYIWRSFTQTDQIRKVQEIPVDCYTCGASGHYGTECGLLTRPSHSGKVTWSASNVQKYVEPTTKERAVSAGVDYSIPPKPKKQFSIKGMGGAGNPYRIDDSEEEEDFIRPKVNNHAAALGHIRFGNTFKGNPSFSNDTLKYPTDSKRGPDTGFGGAYDKGFGAHQMSAGGYDSYQPAGSNPHNPGVQHWAPPANTSNPGRNSHRHPPNVVAGERVQASRKTRKKKANKGNVNAN